MEKHSDAIATLRNYFVETETNDPRQPLSEAQYKQFSDLLNKAIEKTPDDPKLWFWQGWGYQFFRREKEFEWAENAYEQALKLKPDFAPAIIALTYLHWQTALRKAKQRAFEEINQRYNITSGFPEELIGSDEFLKEIKEASQRARESASFEEAQKTWRKYGVGQIAGGYGGQYGGSGDFDAETLISEHGDLLDLHTWYEIFKEMSDDLGLDAEQLVRHYTSFGFIFINYYYPSELSPIIKEVFEAVRRYNGKTPSSYLADALAILAINNTEGAEGNSDSSYGLRLMQELLDLYEENRDNHKVIRVNAFESFASFLEDFFELSPVFCSKNPKDCLALFERAGQLGLLRYPEVVHLHAGRLYCQTGQYDKAVAQFEFAEKYLPMAHQFHWDYIETLVELRRSDVAARFLQGLPEGSGQNRVVAIVMKLLLALKASDDSVEQWIAVIERRLQQSSKLPTEADIEKRCQELWTEYWKEFPERLREAIMTAEYTYELMQNGNRWDFSMIGAQWGKVAEIAFQHSFVLPFSQYLDRHQISEVVTLPNGKNRPEKAISLIGPDLLPENLLKQKQNELVGFLWAASADHHHPVIDMLTEMKLDVNHWTRKVPCLLASVNKLRNQFVHPKESKTFEEVQQLRSILVTKGLLADMGQAMVNQRFLK